MLSARFIRQAKQVTYQIVPSISSVNEGSAVTFNITTTNVPNGTVLYWTQTGTITGADFTDTLTSGSVTINNNTGSIVRTLTPDIVTEGAETFTIQIRTGSISGTVVATSNSTTVNDTSVTPYDPYYASTMILMNADGTGWNIWGSNGDTTGVGSPKFGTASRSFDGVSQYISYIDHASYTLGANNFTVESWIYPVAYPVGSGNQPNATIMTIKENSTNLVTSLTLTMTAGGGMLFNTTTNGTSFYFTANTVGVNQTNDGVIGLNVWSHVAIVRSGNQFTLYVNGIAQISTSAAITIASGGGNIMVGRRSNATRCYAGLIDDLRFTNGVARYTGNFAVPTSAFPTNRS